MIRYRPASFYRFLRSVLGPEASVGVECALPVASAGDGLKVALEALGGRRVVGLPAYTCDRVVAAVLSARCMPRFYDVRPTDGAPARDAVEESIRSGSDVVVLTHFHGLLPSCADLVDTCHAMGAAVVEDRALVIGPGPVQLTKAEFAVYSFGRGKPLPLGGGGLLVAANTDLAERALRLAAAGEERVTGLINLLFGVLRDGSAALEVSRWIERQSWIGPARCCRPEPVAPLSPRRLSASAERSLVRMMSPCFTGELAKGVQSAFSIYKAAFSEVDGFAESMGGRVPDGCVVPALAIRISSRDQAQASLKRYGVDCPQYWRYVIGEIFTDKDFPGARELGESLLFLPLHERVDSRTLRKVVSILKHHEPVAFT